MPQPAIRAYRPAQRAALYEICLRTGDSGADATGRYDDPRLLGHVYLGGYLTLRPQLALVIEDPDGRPLGYAVGVADTRRFEAECERDWWPPLRRRYPDPAHLPAGQRTGDQQLAYLIHHPRVAPPELAEQYPAHLHIDLLPAGQGRGWGRALLSALLDRLTQAGAGGVHLGVAPDNSRAAGFYRRLGFVEIAPFTFAADLPRARSGPEPGRGSRPEPPPPADAAAG